MKKIFLIFLLLIIATPILVGGYFGLVPGVSAIFGSNKPRELGITTSSAALESGNQKTQVMLSSLPATSSINQSLKYEGSHQVEMTLTSEEITSMANNSYWKYSPVSNVQIRINPDGSGEASGLLDFNAATSYARALGVSSADIDKVLSKYPIPKTKFPFYIKLTGSINNDNITAQISSLELARIPVPANIITELTPAAISFVESKYLNNPSISATTLENQNGKVYFKGVLPDKELTVNREILPH